MMAEGDSNVTVVVAGLAIEVDTFNDGLADVNGALEPIAVLADREVLVERLADRYRTRVVSRVSSG
jgi:hypothetical protein